MCHINKENVSNNMPVQSGFGVAHNPRLRRAISEYWISTSYPWQRQLSIQHPRGFFFLESWKYKVVINILSCTLFENWCNFSYNEGQKCWHTSVKWPLFAYWIWILDPQVFFFLFQTTLIRGVRGLTACKNNEIISELKG